MLLQMCLVCSHCEVSLAFQVTCPQLLEALTVKAITGTEQDHRLSNWREAQQEAKRRRLEQEAIGTISWSGCLVIKACMYQACQTAVDSHSDSPLEQTF